MGKTQFETEIKKKKTSKNIKTASPRLVEEKSQYYSRPPQSIKPGKPSIIL